MTTFRESAPGTPLGYTERKVSTDSPLPVVVVSGGGGGPTAWDDIVDKPDVIAAGSTQAEARTAIGAGQPLPAGGTASTYLKGDNTWGTPANTTYTALTAAQAQTGTATTQQTISAKVLADEIERRVAAIIAPLEARVATLEAP